VMGMAERTTETHARSRFLSRHPKAALYADFADFSFWRLQMLRGHLNGGFARAASVTADGLATSLAGADGLLAAEVDAIRHLNQEHPEALSLCASRLAGAPAGSWHACGLDPEGLDLMAGDRTARLVFPKPVTDPDALRRVLKDLADLARASEG
jgi:heme iron utilization protein